MLYDGAAHGTQMLSRWCDVGRAHVGGGEGESGGGRGEGEGEEKAGE